MEISTKNCAKFLKQAENINPQLKVILMSALEIETKSFFNVLPDLEVYCFMKEPIGNYDLIKAYGMQQYKDLLT
jgi:citrate lyase alpha subunit